MNKRYVIYNEKGKILGTGSCPERDFEKQVNNESGLFILEGRADPDEHYVENKKILSKKELNTSYTSEGLSLVFSNLPLGTEVSVHKNVTYSDEAGVEIEYDAPGNYWIHFYPDKTYKQKSLEVSVG